MVSLLGVLWSFSIPNVMTPVIIPLANIDSSREILFIKGKDSVLMKRLNEKIAEASYRGGFYLEIFSRDNGSLFLR